MPSWPPSSTPPTAKDGAERTLDARAGPADARGMKSLVALLLAALALAGCAAPVAERDPLLVFTQVSATRTDTMTIYPDGRTEMNHGGHIERLTFEPAIMDELRAALAAALVDSVAPGGEPRYELTLPAERATPRAIDGTSALGVLLLALLHSHAIP